MFNCKEIKYTWLCVSSVLLGLDVKENNLILGKYIGTSLISGILGTSFGCAGNLLMKYSTCRYLYICNTLTCV